MFLLDKQVDFFSDNIKMDTVYDFLVIIFIM